MSLTATCSPLSSTMASFGSLGMGSRVMNVQLRTPYQKNVRKSSSLTIKCWKGRVEPPPEVLQLLKNGGVVPSSVVPAPDYVTRKDFPADFLFGCCTSALQVESNATEGGRGPGIWDFMIDDGIGAPDIACDSLHRYKDDVKLLKDMGVDVYRFSISWTRIFPDGTRSGGINQAGVDYYNNLINELIDNGVAPFVTLCHFDFPQALQDKYRGYLNRQCVADFKDYADFCFSNFGDRVKHWNTINEPQVVGQFAFSQGLSDIDPLKDPFTAMHNILLSHATVAKLYKDTYQVSQKGEIGVPLQVEWFEAFDDSHPNVTAAKRAFDFFTGWLLEPIVYGDYPFIMKAIVGDNLPTFTDEEKALVKGSYDFIGVNYYTSRYAISVPVDPSVPITQLSDYQHVTLSVTNSAGEAIGPVATGSSEVYVYPEGVRDALIYISKNYGNPKLIVTENGYPEKRDDTIPSTDAVVDDVRIQHIMSHLYAVKEAMKCGADVKGYLMWALMDNMEVGSFYQVRYGLNYIDWLDNLNRIPKKSAEWMNSFLTADDTQAKPAAPLKAPTLVSVS